MGAESAEVSVVLPTYNRLEALRVNFASLLALEGVSEIVVVVDGSSDRSLEWLQAQQDPRIRVIAQPNRGSPAARNAGIDAAKGQWILMTEDDCYLPPDYVTVLMAVAVAHRAQIVSAPWVHVDSLEEISSKFELGRSRSVPVIRLGTHPSEFPAHDVETPFLNGIVLAARLVFEVVRYDESLRGNAWREETSMFLAARRAGLRCVLTPRTASFQLGQWDGGQRRPPLSYELWSIRNNWQFLLANRRELEAMREIRSPAAAQAEFVARRAGDRCLGFARARWRSTRARSLTDVIRGRSKSDPTTRV